MHCWTTTTIVTSFSVAGKVTVNNDHQSADPDMPIDVWNDNLVTFDNDLWAGNVLEQAL